jgi:hypothetical protein
MCLRREHRIERSGTIRLPPKTTARIDVLLWMSASATSPSDTPTASQHYHEHTPEELCDLVEPRKMIAARSAAPAAGS